MRVRARNPIMPRHGSIEWVRQKLLESGAVERTLCALTTTATNDSHRDHVRAAETLLIYAVGRPLDRQQEERAVALAWEMIRALHEELSDDAAEELKELVERHGRRVGLIAAGVDADAPVPLPDR